jgi:hypothetical protein
MSQEVEAHFRASADQIISTLGRNPFHPLADIGQVLKIDLIGL